MPRNYFHGKLVDGGTFSDLSDTTFLKKPNRVLTVKNFHRGNLVGGGYFGGVDSSEFISGVTDLSIETTGLRFFGQDIELDINALTIEASNLEFSGQDLSLNISNTLSVESGTITFTGEDVLLPKVLPIEAGTLSFTGQDVNIAPPVDLSIEAGTLSLTGQDVSLDVVTELTIETSSMTFTGEDIRTTSLTRTCTLEESGSSVGYRDSTVTYGSVSDDSFGTDRIVILQGTTGASIDIFVIQIDNDSLADDAFTELTIELTDGSLVFLQSADADSIQIVNGTDKRWQWEGNKYWVSADDGQTVSWDIA